MDKAKFWEKQYRRGHSRIVGICYRYVNDWAEAQDPPPESSKRRPLKVYQVIGEP
jgi:hypothetical protein